MIEQFAKGDDVPRDWFRGDVARIKVLKFGCDCTAELRGELRHVSPLRELAADECVIYLEAHDGRKFDTPELTATPTLYISTKPDSEGAALQLIAAD